MGFITSLSKFLIGSLQQDLFICAMISKLYLYCTATDLEETLKEGDDVGSKLKYLDSLKPVVFSAREILRFQLLNFKRRLF
jgi:hypothetical protein